MSVDPTKPEHTYTGGERQQWQIERRRLVQQNQPLPKPAASLPTVAAPRSVVNTPAASTVPGSAPTPARESGNLAQGLGALAAIIVVLFFVVNSTGSKNRADPEPVAPAASLRTQPAPSSAPATRLPDELRGRGRSIVPPVQEAPASQIKVELCIPAQLIETQSWDHPEPGSAMADLRETLGSYLLERGDEQIQYRVREGAVETFDQLRRARPLETSQAVLAFDAIPTGQTCPPNNYPYTITKSRGRQ